MLRRLEVGGFLLAGAILVTGAARAQEKHPVYVGVKVCATCHSDDATGNQYEVWRGTKHAQAYKALFTPEAKAMAQLSGILDPPEKAFICLGCHATAADAEPWERDPTFSIEDGMQCERCHGPGSEYIEVMKDPVAAREAGLKMLTPHECALCHYAKGSHVAVHHKPPLDIEEGLRRIAHPRVKRDPASAPTAARTPSNPPPAAPGSKAGADLLGLGLDVTYKTPRNLTMTPDGRLVLVACESANSVVVVDAARRVKVAEIAVGRQPADVAISPDQRRAFVSNRLDDTVSVIDVARRAVVATIPVGDEPHGLLTDKSGATLYVLNTSSGDVSVVDIATLKETKRLEASRDPWSLALSPDGSRLAVTNTLSRLVGFREPSVSEVTVVDTKTRQVVDRAAVPGANLLQGVAWHPSGEFALFTLNRTKNLVPMTRLLQGWTITNGLGVLWRDGRVDQVLLDEPNHYFADATDVAFAPDGKHAVVTSAGTDRAAIVDVDRLVGLLRRASAEERRDVIPNHLGKSAEFVVGYVPTRNSPRGVVVSPDGRSAWVANALDDSLTVIDLTKASAETRVDLGGPRQITKVRWGERLFNSANITFQRQFACHSCHPDGHVDGLTYDIEADGLGVSPVDNRTLRGIYDTDPFKWEGTNATLARQCGPRLAVFFTRIAPFTPEQLSALNDYIVTIPRPPNRHRPVGAPLTNAQRRGKLIFERTSTNDGREIRPEGRCANCHFPPYFTDRSKRDVGTKYLYDRQGDFDVPHLNNIYDSAPYLHNGMANTLEEIWTRFNPKDTHGVTNDLTKDQLNDLIEYLKTL
jgi:YVTN family beta-propeller protein